MFRMIVFLYILYNKQSQLMLKGGNNLDYSIIIDADQQVMYRVTKIPELFKKRSPAKMIVQLNDNRDIYKHKIKLRPIEQIQELSKNEDFLQKLLLLTQHQTNDKSNSEGKYMRVNFRLDIMPERYYIPQTNHFQQSMYEQPTQKQAKSRRRKISIQKNIRNFKYEQERDKSVCVRKIYFLEQFNDRDLMYLIEYNNNHLEKCLGSILMAKHPKQFVIFLQNNLLELQKKKN